MFCRPTVSGAVSSHNRRESQINSFDWSDVVKVFVTGGTGVLGRATIRRLLARGHKVVALAHNDHAVEKLHALDATPVRGDLFDPGALVQMVEGSEAIIHLATRIPASSRMRKASAWQENDRLRAEGTTNLVDAGIAAGVGVVVYPSVVFLYPDSGSQWIDATTSGQRTTPFLKSTVAAESQVQRFTDAGGRGVVLRLAWLYGQESSHTLEAREYAKKGIAAIAGRGDAYQSWIWDQDAAEAIVMAMEHAPAGIYDVVDDEPVSRNDLVRAMASGVGRKNLRRLPGIVTRLATGGTVAEMAGRSQRVSNRRFKEATGWKPTVHNVYEGWKQLAG
jgi:nucleoside-diphosphate-sugar epimerase